MKNEQHPKNKNQQQKYRITLGQQRYFFISFMNPKEFTRTVNMVQADNAIPENDRLWLQLNKVI